MSFAFIIPNESLLQGINYIKVMTGNMCNVTITAPLKMNSLVASCNANHITHDFRVIEVKMSGIN